MTGDRRGADLVDRFLADLGGAPVPVGLSTTVAAHVRGSYAGERQPLARNRWLPLAVALTLLVAVVIGLVAVTGGPDPTPSLVPSPPVSLSPSAQASPSPEASASREPSPTELASPSPTTSTDIPTPTAQPPSPTPATAGVFEFELIGQSPEGRLAIRVVDPTGRLVEAAPAEAFVGPGEGPPDSVTVRRGADDRTLLVGWTTFFCDERAVLTVETPTTLRVRYPPRPGCDTIGTGYAITLTFDRSVDPTTIDGRQPEGEWAVSIADLRPTTIAWFDELHGWVGGRTVDGDPVIAFTSDGGATWQLGGHHAHVVSALAAVDPGRAIAGTGCFESLIDPDCSAFTNLVGSEGGGGLVAHEEQAWTLSFEGRVGYGRFADLGPDEARRTADGGETWTTVTVGCVADGARPAYVSPVDQALVYALCHTAPTDGAAHKELLVSRDGGRTWERRLHSSDSSGLPSQGQVNGLEMAGDGTGIIWGAGMPMPLLILDDTGAIAPWPSIPGSWTVVEAAYFGANRATLLVHDLGERATRLITTSDGESWREIRRWPLPPTSPGG